jgi:hypothetical protein
MLSLAAEISMSALNLLRKRMSAFDGEMIFIVGFG